MDGLGDEFLAGAALALDEDGGGGAGGDFGDELEQGDHFGGDGDDFATTGLAAYLVAEGGELGAEVIGFEGVLDGDVKFIEIDGFTDEIVGAELESAFDIIELRGAGHHDDDGEFAGEGKIFQEIHAAAIGEMDVEKHDFGGIFAENGEGLLEGGGLKGEVTSLAAFFGEGPAEEGFIINDEDGGGGHRLLGGRKEIGRLERQRKREKEVSALGGGIDEVECATMSLSGLAGEGKAEAGSVGFGAEERMEN